MSLLVAHKYIYQTKCIRSPFIGDMLSNHPITGIGGLFPDHFKTIQHANKHEIVFHNLKNIYITCSTKRHRERNIAIAPCAPYAASRVYNPYYDVNIMGFPNPLCIVVRLRAYFMNCFTRLNSYLRENQQEQSSRKTMSIKFFFHEIIVKLQKGGNMLELIICGVQK